MTSGGYVRRPIQRDVSDVVVDDAEKDSTIPVESYDISSFGADYDVNGLVGRLERGDIFIPSFQRNYVWNQKEASRFVESLLLGLPVPGVFLARETSSQQMFVIDGQQRLLSLLFYYGGYFHPHASSSTRKVFTLQGVQKRLEGRTYDKLDDRDRRKLGDSIIHATIVKQDSPKNDDTSIYHIFERLNTAGRKLAPQEIRTAIYHGPFIDLLDELNKHSAWREIMGKPNTRLKDQELILRFLALLHNQAAYERPMEEFLSKFLKVNKNAKAQVLDSYERAFSDTITVIAQAIGIRAFRPLRAVNAAVLDAVMVGLARRLSRGEIAPEKYDQVSQSYDSLLENPAFRSAWLTATSDETNVNRRLDLATREFSKL